MLAKGAADSYAYAQAAYEFVRDTIPHSADSGDPRVTWRASTVLEQRTGICHAKAHALTALLRAEDIPTALCYQRLLHDDGDGHVVHGLVAVRFNGAWHRQDPAGQQGGRGRAVLPRRGAAGVDPGCKSPMRWTIRYCTLNLIRSCWAR